MIERKFLKIKRNLLEDEIEAVMALVNVLYYMLPMGIIQMRRECGLDVWTLPIYR